jgi:hypothetical protein
MFEAKIPNKDTKEKTRIEFEKILKRLHIALAAHWPDKSGKPKRTDPAIVKKYFCLKTIIIKFRALSSLHGTSKKKSSTGTCLSMIDFGVPTRCETNYLLGMPSRERWRPHLPEFKG